MTSNGTSRRSVPLSNWHCRKCGHLLAKVGADTGPVSIKCGACGELNILA